MIVLRYARAVAGVALIALAAACGPSSKPMPADPKARSEFLAANTAKLKTDERVLLDHFIGRLDAQTKATGKAVEVSIPRAVEIQRGYETQLGQMRRNLQQLQGSAKAALNVEVRDAKVIRDEKAKPPGDKALRFLVNVTNQGDRAVENLTLRLEFRDTAGQYVAVIPGLQLTGKLLPGDVGRITQSLPLDAQRHQYILAGNPVQINAYPIRIAYVGGAVIEPGKELQALESLHRAKIE